VYRLETGNDRPLKPADVALIYDKVQLLDVWEETCRWWISADEKKKRYNPMNIGGLVERYQQNAHTSSVVDDLPLYRLPIGEKREELLEAFRRAQRPIDKRRLVQEARDLLERMEEEERGNVTHPVCPGGKVPAASWDAAMELEKVLQSNTRKPLFQGARVLMERKYQRMVEELERRGIPRPDSIARPDGQEGHGATNGTADDGTTTKGDGNGGIDG
jgi:hypothetical protein